MKQIATASQKRSLADFQKILVEHKKELQDDAIIRAHLDSLYDHLLEQNLCRLIEPFSKVQVAHIASLIKLPNDVVEKKFSGILDQGTGVLIVFDETPVDKTYESSLE